MIALTQFPAREVAFGFATGVLFMALLTLTSSALAQTPAPDMHETVEWCRQMLGSIDLQSMLEVCRGMMVRAGGMMQGMMSGMCMGR